MLLLQPKNRHVFGLDMEELGFMVSKWYQDVTMSARRLSAFGRDILRSLTSLSRGFCLGQFCSPFVGFFRLENSSDTTLKAPHASACSTLSGVIGIWVSLAPIAS